MKIVKIPKKYEEIAQFFQTGISLHNARERVVKYFRIKRRGCKLSFRQKVEEKAQKVSKPRKTDCDYTKFHLRNVLL